MLLFGARKAPPAGPQGPSTSRFGTRMRAEADLLRPRMLSPAPAFLSRAFSPQRMRRISRLRDLISAWPRVTSSSSSSFRPAFLRIRIRYAEAASPPPPDSCHGRAHTAPREPISSRLRGRARRQATPPPRPLKARWDVRWECGTE
ncbi:hypothetical protein P7K49_034522 [Saguinus oedipus]|uniref:Uncharacterized protein n=1 Tax=Saguinus oedipus TaxID=9490 RepID=A0ABQ9TVU1_SAGOE|nr:hypothetical protein P7K49_034522 [Saguinus oedipus]